MGFQVLVLAFGLLVGGTSVADVEVQRLSKSNTVALVGIVKTPLMVKLLQDLKAVPAQEQAVLYLDSPGGSLDAGLWFIDSVLALKRPVTCVAYYAASMAMAIFQSQACTTRVVTPNSVLMQHQARFGLRAQSQHNLVSRMSLWNALLSRISLIHQTRMGIKADVYNDLVQHDLWIYGVTALAYKATDEVRVLLCDADYKTCPIESRMSPRLSGTQIKLLNTLQAP